MLQYIDKVVDVPGDAVASLEACERISHIFYVLLALFSWNVDLISSSPLYLAATCSCALRQSTEAFGRISSIFHVKSGLRAPRAVLTLEIWNYFYEQRASVFVAFGRISHIFIVKVYSDFPAQVALENLDIFPTCSLMAVGRGFRRL